MATESSPPERVGKDWLAAFAMLLASIIVSFILWVPLFVFSTVVRTARTLKDRPASFTSSALGR
jgi:hypothetical protein